VVICVPTPLKKNNDPDISFIKNTMSLIKNHLTKNQILILESTSYPGTTREEFVQKLDKKDYTEFGALSHEKTKNKINEITNSYILKKCK
jgi:UDP-N-acetyl-D-mannosaminuronate dehydrogenase